MPDDEMHGDDPSQEVSEEAGAVAGGAGREDPAAGDTPAGAETSAGAEPATEEEGPPTRDELLRAVNSLVQGELTLHYPVRDVVLPMDGASALRLLTMHWRRSANGLADRLDPARSSAAAAWIVLDVTEPMAMTWRPRLGPSARRTALDPPLPTR